MCGTTKVFQKYQSFRKITEVTKVPIYYKSTNSINLVCNHFPCHRLENCFMGTFRILFDNFGTFISSFISGVLGGNSGICYKLVLRLFLLWTIFVGTFLAFSRQGKECIGQFCWWPSGSSSDNRYSEGGVISVALVFRRVSLISGSGSGIQILISKPKYIINRLKMQIYQIILVSPCHFISRSGKYKYKNLKIQIQGWGRHFISGYSRCSLAAASAQ